MDECQAEALFWLVILFYEKQEEIQRHDNLEAFLRQKLAYKLKEYWCRVATSTFSYLRKKGKKLPTEQQVNDATKVTKYNDVDIFIAIQSAIRHQCDWDVYELYIKGNTSEEIAYRLEITERRVRRILTRIKKRLKKSYASDE